jgi:hypothetical protein
MIVPGMIYYAKSSYDGGTMMELTDAAKELLLKTARALEIRAFLAERRKWP